MKSVSTRRRVSARLLAVFLSLCLIAPGGLHAATVAGSIPGQFSVSESGAATYGIPIQVPPGTGGIEPKLSLNYNSQGGNGLLGVGWSLGGLSAIGRCPKTLVQDGVKRGINYDANDRYCLDGQRLVAITGTYGADGTEYRTERESFTKVVSYGTAGNGPVWWKVWTKSGQVMEYGNTADSRIEALKVVGSIASWSASTVRIWALNKVSDTKGNYLTASYTKDTVNGDFYPSRIDYTGNTNTGQITNNSLRFTFQDRFDENVPYDDTITSYIGWSIVKTKKRLHKLRGYQGDTLVGEYRLTYANTTVTPNSESRLISLIQCDGADNCLPATTFQWQVANKRFDYALPAIWSFNAPSGNKILIADANGDGVGDLLVIQPAFDQSYISVYLSTGGGFSAPVLNHEVLGRDVVVGFGDVNGDGKADIVLSDGTVRLSTGSGFAAPAIWYGPSGTLLVVADANGDGLGDVLAFQGGSYPYSVSVSYSNGSRFLTPIYTPIILDQNVAVVGFGDVDGDGLADVMVSGDRGRVHLSTGTGFTAEQWFAVPQGTMYQFSDFFLMTYAPAGTGESGPPPSASVFTPSGLGFTTQYSTASNLLHRELGWDVVTGLGDVDGDGLPDIVQSDGLVRLAQQPLPHLLTSITTGLGAVTTITYKPQTDGVVYAADSGAAYPIQELKKQGPQQLVSSVLQSNGTGGTVVSNYFYRGGRLHVYGGGFLGFRQVDSTDAASGIKTVSTVRQDYPYQGLPSSIVTQTSGGTVLKRVTNTWTDQLLTPAAGSGGKWNKSQLTQSVEESFELNGAAVTTVTTTSQYDDWGNPTQIVVGTGDGYSKTTTNTYTNNTGNWLLGRLMRSTVASTAPAPTPLPPPPPPPSITLSAITPSSGPTAGGTTFTLTGTGFTSGTTVTVGSAAATGCTIASPGSMTCTTPAGTVGAKNVVATKGSETATLTGGFTYVAPLSLTSVSPSSGQTMGGTTITLTGTTFAAGATVTVGGVAATSCTVASSTTMTCVTPAGTAGAKNVVVTSGGSSATLTNGYTYVAATASVTPSPFTFTENTCQPEYGTVTFKNTSTVANLKINGIGVSAAPFYYGERTVEGYYSGNYGTCVVGNTLAPNATCTIRLTFYSTGGGQTNGTLNVTHNGTGGQTNVPLSGACYMQ